MARQGSFLIRQFFDFYREVVRMTRRAVNQRRLMNRGALSGAELDAMRADLEPESPL